VPANTVAPVISSSTAFVEVAAVLTTTNGTWSNTPSSYAYQWQRGGVDIAAATAQTYTLVTADVGANITCRVTASNVNGAGTPVSSNALGPVLTRRMVPSDIMGLVAYYDPNDLAGLVQSGGFCSQLNDLSGNGRHQVQATGANQPAVSANSLNGTTALLFTGPEYLLWADTSIPYAGGWSSAVVLMPDWTASVSNARAVSCAGPSNGDTVAAAYAPAVRNVSNNAIGVGVANGSFFTNHAAADDTWYLLSGKRNTGNLLSRLNGADEQTNATGTGTSGTGRISHGTALASSAGIGTSRWRGKVASFAFYTGFLADSDLRSLEGILAWKANAPTVLLDAAHPYRSAPPRI